LIISNPIDGDQVVHDSLVDFLGKQSDLDDCCARSKAFDGPDANGLLAADRLAIWIYTSHFATWFAQINSELWAPGGPYPAVRGFARILNRALEQLPPYEGLVYRGYESSSFLNDLAKYVSGATVVWPGFTSTTTDPDVTYRGNMLFTIYSRSGRKLGSYADFPGESEVTFRTDTKFLVIDVDRRASDVVIELYEISEDERVEE
jgi:hypothetical protein